MHPIAGPRSPQQSCGPLETTEGRHSVNGRSRSDVAVSLSSRVGQVTMASSATGAVRYGESSLADVLPSALAALGVAGEPNVLAIEPAECVVVLLVDGLGWQLLRAHSDEAPFL